ncbi:cupin domain-containing protein [Cohnella sp. JJ-181]|uniref:cupin domain-containing protein n=1 Tax=Cohnella rhizoplanae TaxID=2974897 RepID=UPI002FE4AC27
MAMPEASVLQTSVHQMPVLQSPSLNLSADSNQKVNYAKNEQNFVTQLFAEQLPAVKTGFFNVHMSQGVVVSPHWHTNATELVILISGEVQTSVFNPFTQQLMTYRLKPGQVSQFPMGWFHWIVALTDHTYLLTIFDVPTPDIVLGGDFLRVLPPEVAARAYCVNPAAYAQAVAPIQKPVVILGPPPGCSPAPGAVQGASAQQGAGYPHASAQGAASPGPMYPGAMQGVMQGMMQGAMPQAQGMMPQAAMPQAMIPQAMIPQSVMPQQQGSAPLPYPPGSGWR